MRKPRTIGGAIGVHRSRGRVALMSWARAFLLLPMLGACGGTTAVAHEQPSEQTPTSDDTWLAALPRNSMLTYQVTGADGQEHDVRMVVQQRVERGASIAV